MFAKQRVYFFYSFVREVFALQTKMLSQFSHNCLKTVSKSSQFVFILLLWILNMSEFEPSSFNKNEKKIILPARFFVWGQLFFSKKTTNLSFFALRAKDFHTSDVNVSAVFSNLRCTSSERVFGRKFSWKKLPSTFNLTLGRTFPDFEQSSLDLRFTNFIFLFSNKMMESQIVWTTKRLWLLPNFERKDFALQTKLLSQLSQNCILRTRTVTLEQFVCQEN